MRRPVALTRYEEMQIQDRRRVLIVHQGHLNRSFILTGAECYTRSAPHSGSSSQLRTLHPYPFHRQPCFRCTLHGCDARKEATDVSEQEKKECSQRVRKPSWPSRVVLPDSLSDLTSTTFSLLAHRNLSLATRPAYRELLQSSNSAITRRSTFTSPSSMPVPCAYTPNLHGGWRS